MKVCVISDSMAAALKLGHDALEPAIRDRLDVTFFASRATSMGCMVARDGRLVATEPDVAKNITYTSGGSEDIDPARYDAFVLHALGVEYLYALLDTVYRTPAFVESVTRASAMDTIAFHIHRELRKVTDKPVWISPRPFVSVADAKLCERVNRSPTPRYEMASVVLSVLANDAASRWLPQAPDTVVEALFTRHELCEGSTRLDLNDPRSGEPHPTTDLVHMNGEYGRAFWKQFDGLV